MLWIGVKTHHRLLLLLLSLIMTLRGEMGVRRRNGKIVGGGVVSRNEVWIKATASSRRPRSMSRIECGIVNADPCTWQARVVDGVTGKVSLQNYFRIMIEFARNTRVCALCLTLLDLDRLRLFD